MDNCWQNGPWVYHAPANYYQAVHVKGAFLSSPKDLVNDGQTGPSESPVKKDCMETKLSFTVAIDTGNSGKIELPDLHLLFH